MDFKKVAQLFFRIEKTASRNEISDQLVRFFTEVSTDDAEMFLYLLQGRVAPMFIPVEFGFSEKSILNSIKTFAKLRSVKIDVTKARNELGDIGLVVEEFVRKLHKEAVTADGSARSGEAHSNIDKSNVAGFDTFELSDVYRVLWKIALARGKGSMEVKQRYFIDLIAQMRPQEARYFARIVSGELRLGCSIKTVLDVFSMLLAGTKEIREELDLAYGFSSDIGYLAELILTFIRKDGVVTSDEGGDGKVYQDSGRHIDMKKVNLLLKKIKPTAGFPIFPRLVERVSGFNEAVKRMDGEFFVQPKFDGMRCQLHKGVSYSKDVMSGRVWNKYFTQLGGNLELTEAVGQEKGVSSGLFTVIDNVNTNVKVGSDNSDNKGGSDDSDANIASKSSNDGDTVCAGKIKLFSRNLEELTNMFPDIVAFAESLDCESCILDGEIVGFNDGKFLPFQDTMTRRRKYKVKGRKESVPVRYFVFDILMLDGKDLSRKRMDERVKICEDLLPPSELVGKGNHGKGKNNWKKYLSMKKKTEKPFPIVFANTELIKTESELNKQFIRHVGLSLEGSIVKRKSAGYLPGVRDYDWIKLKKSMKKKLVDTVDLVVLGYYAGSGKQAKFGIGAILAGVYDSNLDKFVPVTKVGTGIKDTEWQVIAERLASLKIDMKAKSVLKDGVGDEPTVWVQPEVVITVEADEISRSQVYRAGEAQLGFGLALRFPRLEKFDRDKLPTDATSVNELVAMYKMGMSN